MPDAHAFSLAVRWLHVGSMSLAFGGAALLVVFAWGTTGAVDRHRQLLALAARYEWVFWTALGLLAMTGVGNAAAFAGGLPAPTSTWETIFTSKLALVIALATFSVPRTLIVSMLGAATDAAPERVLEAMRASYLLTALALAAILALAVWLAHQ